MLTLENLFTQASGDTRSAMMVVDDSTSFVRHGIKITRYGNGEIALFYIGLGSHHYEELDDTSLGILMREGWHRGCTKVAIRNRKGILYRLEQQLESETEERMRRVIAERISECEEKIQTLLSKYNGNS